MRLKTPVFKTCMGDLSPFNVKSRDVQGPLLESLPMTRGQNSGSLVDRDYGILWWATRKKKSFSLLGYLGLPVRTLIVFGSVTCANLSGVFQVTLSDAATCENLAVTQLLIIVENGAGRMSRKLNANH